MGTPKILGIVAGLSGLLLSTAAVPGAVAEPASYVALGDSYSSGTGTRAYLPDGTSCERSVHAFPSLVAAAKGHDLNFRACSGATVDDVADVQLDALSPTTAYVTVSVGGNDAGFAEVLTECALPAWMSRCHREIDRAQAFIVDTLPTRLRGLYADIGGRATAATVVVVGYPRLFNGTDCNALTWFSAREMKRLNQTANKLNRRLRIAAEEAGFGWANPTRRFRDHAVCAPQEWLNGLSHPVTESYHPNRAGHSSGYTRKVGSKLVGAPVVVTAGVRAAARASRDGLTAEQRRYADVDAAITPKRFEAPDLSTRRARLAALRAGVDLSDPRSIDRADRRHARAEAR